MGKWMKYTLSEIGKIITGKTPSSKDERNFGNSYPFITPKDIQVNKYVYTTERYLSEQGMQAVKSCVIPANSICVSCIGNLGYVAMTTETSITNQQINSVIPDTKRFDSDFIYYLLKYLNPYFKNLEGQSTTLSILNKSQFSEIEVFAPECMPTQSKIAKILSVLDDKSENNRKINNHLEQMAQAIFKSWFVDFEPWGGVMPKDWREGILGDLASITSGKRPPCRQAECSAEAETPILGASSIMGYTNTVLCDEKILVTGRVGTHGVIQRYSRPCWPSDNTLVIKSIYYEYIYQQLCRVDFHNMNRGSTQPLITQTDLKSVFILLPNEGTLCEFEKLVGSFMDRYESNILESEYLAELRDTLLPRLMSGELYVSDIGDAKS